MRIVVFLGLYWGPLILGNYHIRIQGLGFRVNYQLLLSKAPYMPGV